MSLKNTTVILAFALLIVGCSGGSGGGAGTGAGGNNIPSQINESPISTKPKLTSAEKEDLKAVFAPLKKVPTPDLYLIDADESAEEKAERLQKIAELSTDGKKMLSEINAKCTLKHPVKNQTELKPEVGSTAKMTEVSSASGTTCPVNVAESNASDVLVTESAADFSSFKTSSSGVMSSSNKIVTDNAQKMSRMKEFNITGTFSGQTANGNQEMTMHSNMDAVATITHIDKGAVRIDIKMEMLVHGAEGTQVQTTVATDYVISYGSKVVDIQVRVVNEKTLYYLNGEELSEREVKDIFGSAMIVNTSN